MVYSVNVSIKCGFPRICLWTHLDECVGLKPSYDVTDELFCLRKCQVVICCCSGTYLAADGSEADHALDFF